MSQDPRKRAEMLSDDAKRAASSAKTTPDIRAQAEMLRQQRESQKPTVQNIRKRDVQERQKAAESPLQVIWQDFLNFFRRFRR